MMIYLIAEDSPEDGFVIVTNGYTSYKLAWDKLCKLKKKLGDYHTQYYDIVKLKVVK